MKPTDYRELPPGAGHYRAFVGPPREYDRIGAEQFRLLTSFGLREQHSLLDFGCGSLRAGRLFIPYLNPGRYFGVEPNRALVEDAFRFELGQEIRRLKRPEFRHNDDFRIPFEDAKFDYILAQSIFTHTGPDICALLLSEIERSLAPAGLGLVNFLKVSYVEREADAPGWVYPACVAYRAETVERMAAQARLAARRLPWSSPRATWFVLHRLGEERFTAYQLQTLRGPVLLDSAYTAAQLPANASLIAVDGRECLVAGSVYSLRQGEYGYLEAADAGPVVLTLSGWALDPTLQRPADFVIATHKETVLEAVEFQAAHRPDVAKHFHLCGTVSAGFGAAYVRPADYEPGKLRVLAAFPSGTAAELPWYTPR